jgi:hypothetical protein
VIKDQFDMGSLDGKQRRSREVPLRKKGTAPAQQAPITSYLDQPVTQISSIKERESYVMSSCNETANFNPNISYFNSTLSMGSTLVSKPVSLNASLMGHRSSSQLKLLSATGT